MAGGAGEPIMDNRFSFKIYPRKDKVFTHKKSLNFDLMRTKVMKEREYGP